MINEFSHGVFWVCARLLLYRDEQFSALSGFFRSLVKIISGGAGRVAAPFERGVVRIIRLRYPSNYWWCPSTKTSSTASSSPFIIPMQPIDRVSFDLIRLQLSYIFYSFNGEFVAIIASIEYSTSIHLSWNVDPFGLDSSHQSQWVDLAQIGEKEKKWLPEGPFLLPAFSLH